MKFIAVSLFLGCAALPAAAVTISAGANIQAAVDSAPAGTVFQLQSGLYRMQTVVPKPGDQFLGTLDGSGNRLTVLSGAQTLSGFNRDGYGNYVAATTQTQPGLVNGFCAPGYGRCNLPEDFFYDDQPYLHNSTGPQAVQPGQYYFDYPTGRIFFRPANSGDNPALHKVEYSRTALAFWGSASGVVIRNLVVEKYASPVQFGALGGQYPGQGWVMQNNEVRLNHGAGVRVGNDGQALDNYIHDNGQLGMSGTGRNQLVQNNELARNNYAGVDHNFECGGAKFSNVDGLTVRNNNAHDNIGPGVWIDLSTIHTLLESNQVNNNSRAGIFYETSYDGVIRNNLIMNNGSFAPDDWFWNAGIQIAASSNVEVYGNTVFVNSFNNGNGIMMIQQNRNGEPCTHGPCKVANNFVHENYIAVTGNRWHGTSGIVQDYWGFGDISAPAANNRFQGNYWFVTDLNSTVYWYWANTWQSFRAFQSFGQDVSGSLFPSFL